MPNDQEEAAALAAIEATFATLEAWSTRTSAVHLPEPGSDLDTDNRLFEPLPLSELAWMSLISVSDHLKGVRRWLVDGELFPLAQYTLTRGAMVGAAQAVWLLAPDQAEERQRRGLRVADEWYRNHIMWLNEAIDNSPTGGPYELREHVQKRHLEVKGLRAALDDRADLQLTGIVRWAAQNTFAESGLRRAASMLWRSGSGDAHALGWGLLTRSAEMTPTAGGMGTFVATGGITDLAEPYLCAYHMARRGWELLDQRSH